MNTDRNVDILNEMLRGELSAVETYDQALQKLKDDAVASQLTDCRASHQERVTLLQREVTRLGGSPSDSSGSWGTFAKLVEGSAKAFGKAAAIAALEEGEDHGLKQYRDDLPKLDGNTRSILEKQLLPKQEQTHRAMSTLKKTLY
jgi:uncharacterized protein (TIGR02284 family)